jgi:hypothetical protein
LPKFGKLPGAFTIFLKKGYRSGYVYAELLDFTLGAKEPEPPRPAPKNPPGSVEISYDRFKDETTMTGNAHLGPCQDKSESEPLHLDFGALIKFASKDLKTVTSITLKVRLLDMPRFRFGSNPDFVFFTDEKRLPLGTGNLESKSYRVYRITMSESIATLPISLDSFKQIANSKKVEAKVGEVEFAPSDIQGILPVFQEMLRRMDLKK